MSVRGRRLYHRTDGRILVVAVLLIGSGQLGQAAAPTARSGDVIVRAYDTFGVRVRTVEEARSTARALLSDAGIDADWRDCTTPGQPVRKAQEACEDVLNPRELIVRILAAPKTITDPEVLGYAHVDLERGGGTLATVFADRIRGLAIQLHVTEGALLGRAIAHEIGHLLLGTLTHSQTGLMRAHWSTNRPVEEWMFSSAESAQMRDGLTARIRTDVLALARTSSERRK